VSAIADKSSTTSAAGGTVHCESEKWTGPPQREFQRSSKQHWTGGESGALRKNPSSGACLNQSPLTQRANTVSMKLLDWHSDRTNLVIGVKSTDFIGNFELFSEGCVTTLPSFGVRVIVSKAGSEIQPSWEEALPFLSMRTVPSSSWPR
jgi:hypothetical protein